MTQLENIQKDSKKKPFPNENKKQKQFNDMKKEKIKIPFWLNELFISSCACVLLAIGLLIIGVTFFLAVQEKRDTSRGLKLQDNKKRSNYGISSSDVVSDSNNGDVLLDTIKSGEWVDMRHNGRLIIDDIFGHIHSTLSGCEEKLCKIACSNEGSLFASLYRTMLSSSCPDIDVVFLDSQQFPDNILKNSWWPLNRSVHEIIIRGSNLTKINDSAFNSPLFTNTLIMSWLKLNVDTVESGALLGLYKLKYLTIISNIRILETALFQPVQTTLSHLKLNAQLELHGNQNLFGVTYMNKLEYLDLSQNHINGTLSRKMFASTPNLKYLIMENCHIKAIRKSAFTKLEKKLIFLNLSKNLLRTLSASTVLPIVEHNKGAIISLGHNKWLCDCNLRALSKTFTNYRNQFMDAVYCSEPRNLFGVSIDKVKYEGLNCEPSSTTIQALTEEGIEENQGENGKPSSTKLYSNTPIIDLDTSDFLDSREVSSTELSNVLKMRCVEPTQQTLGSETSTTDSTSSSSASISSSSSQSKSLELNARSADDGILKFPAPDHEFDLQLIAENNTVKISIENPSDLMIIWFSEEQESSSVTYNDMSVDYECMRYSQPNLVVGPLVENTTYTFCLIPRYQTSISPFNCLPLYVPMKRDENIWISQENKQFTIGMLCLIFMVSTVVGGLIAYFGIKTFPDLLEGSKNVVVVKKSEQECYVATITETDYLKNSNTTIKRKPSVKEEVSMEVPKEASRKKSSIRLPLPPTPGVDIRNDAQSPCLHSPLKMLDRISSDVSSATCFEDNFPECFLFPQDDYETPKVCENIYTLEQRMVPNNYNMSPSSPPPLPKRNSNISDSSTLILNRFSRNM